MSTLRPLRRQRLADRTADLLRDRILSGDFAGGERLVEARIAEQLQISRGPVREALKQLGAEGLVREEPRRGAFVVSMARADVREVYDLRAALEARAARAIIEQGDRAILNRLEEMLEPIERAVRERDATAVVNADLKFHEAVVRLSGNSRLHRVFVSQASTLGALLRMERERSYPGLSVAVREHRALVKAIKSGDVHEAEELFVDHIEQARDRLMTLVSEQPTG